MGVRHSESTGLSDGRGVGCLGLRRRGRGRVDPAETSDLSSRSDVGFAGTDEGYSTEERNDSRGTHISSLEGR